MNERERKEIQIFSAALELSSAAERAEYLRQACADDVALLQKVEALLQMHAEADQFFGSVTTDRSRALLSVMSKSPQPGNTDSLGGLTEKPGASIGAYKLLEQIGEGGFGVVYMAEQNEPIKRRVALKIIKVGMDTREVVARFEAERQALAMMDHPNIAKIHDAGATDTGRPYFVMELVRGIRVTDYCDQKNLSTRERLDLFIQVCQAVQHAHQKGIIHRDLKSSNILVTINDGAAVPKIIDFGIAKATRMELTQKTVFTRFQEFIGTPAYMSPEQAEITSVDIDTRSDIYSLGVLLYELLTGKTPFDAKELLQAGLDEMRRTLREKEPERPSTRVSTLGREDLTTTAKRRGLEPPKLINLLRGDLDWIVMKCLEKDRSRRYETANGLATDIQRHMKNEPVVASPPSMSYKVQKFIRRNQVMVAAAAVVAAVLLLGMLVSTWQAVRAMRAERGQSRLRQQAQTNEAKAKTEAEKSRQVARFLQEMLEGVGPSKALGRDTTMLREILDKTAARVATGLTNQPEAEIALRSILARTYDELGLYKQAEEMSRESLRLAQSHLGEEDVAVAKALQLLGNAQIHLGNYQEAEKSTRGALAMYRKLLGDERPEVATSLDILAGLLSRQVKLTEAEATARKALEMRRRLFGNENHDVVASLGNLAFVLLQHGRLAEAEAMSREALATLRKLLGDEHPEVATFLNELGLILEHQGKHAEGEATHREALAIRRKLLGNDHPEVAQSLHNLASELQRQGKLSEAEAALREALSLSRKRLGNEHPDVAFSLATLASVLKYEGKLSEAETMTREALAMRLKLLGNEHPDVGTSLNNLGTVLEAQGKFAEAEAIYREALAMQRKMLGNGHAFVALALGNLANVLGREGKLVEAEVLCREALAIRRKVQGDDHPDVSRTLNILAYILQENSKLGEAEMLLHDQLLRSCGQPLGDDAGLAVVLARLAFILIAEQRFTEAEQMARECLAVREKTLADDWVTFHIRSILGGTLLEQQKYAEAEPLLLSGYEGLKQREAKIRSAGSPSLQEALQRLVQLYQATGRPEEAAEWKKKSAELDKPGSGAKANTECKGPNK